MVQPITQIDYDQIWESVNPDILCIVYYGRSGTLFFQSLLDGHEQVMMFPSATTLRFNELWGQCENMGLDEKISFFCAAWPWLFEGLTDKSDWRLSELGPNKDENMEIKQEKFVRHWGGFLRNRPASRKNFFLAAHYAFTLCRGEDIFKKKLLVHPLHTPHRKDRLKPFMEDFPLTKTILMVREPLKTLMSIDLYNVKKFKKVHGDFIYELVFRRLIPFDTWTHAFQPHLTLSLFCPKNQIRALKLEDLHNDSVNTLQKVAAWLGIAYTDSLLKSTFGNKLWWGDNLLSFYVNGFSTHIHSGDRHEHYHFIDIYVLGFLLEDIFVNYGYTVPNIYKGVFKKVLVFIGIFVPTKKEIEVIKDFFSPRYLRDILKLASLNFKRNEGGFLAITCCKHAASVVIFFGKILVRQARFCRYFFRRLTGRTVTFELIK